MIRLFVGIALPNSHRERLSLMCHGIQGARWVAPENLHVTLRFIGEVDEDVGEGLALALSHVTTDPFAITLKTLGTFGHPPHALLAGVEDDPCGALAALHANVESALVREGLEPEHRKYTPHVTLARFGARSRHVNMNRVAIFMQANAELALEPFDVTGITLFQSHLRPEGAQYEPMAEFAFA